MKNRDRSKEAPESEPNIPLMEMLKSIPEVFGIRVNEEPSYEVLRKDENFEVRKYAELVRANVTLEANSYEEFKEKAFKILASYIFGENREEIQMPMTAPVLQRENEKGSWSMSFVLPKSFTMSNAPLPKNASVELEPSPERYVAVLAYSGNNDEEKIKAHQQELYQWVQNQPELQALESVESAQYDAPFVIPFLKKNEVHMGVLPLSDLH